MAASQFYTVDEAEEGLNLPLVDREGKATDSWLKIRGIDSDVFRDAKIQADRKAFEVAKIEDDTKRLMGIIELKRKLTAALVIEWSEDIALEHGAASVENTCKFFALAPQIQERVDKLAGNRELFFMLQSKGLSDGAEKTPNSTLKSENQSTQNESTT